MKRLWIITVLLCLLTIGIHSAYADIDATYKINIFNQSTFTQKYPIINGKKYNIMAYDYNSKETTLAKVGCGVFAYTHAIEWLTDQKFNSSEYYTVFENLLTQSRKPMGGPRKAYTDYVKETYGFRTVSRDKSSYENQKKWLINHFENGGVLIAHVFWEPEGGHWLLAVGYTFHEGDFYIHLVDSSAHSTTHRIPSYDYRTFELKTDNTDNDQYWVKLSSFTDNGSKDWKKYKVDGDKEYNAAIEFGAALLPKFDKAKGENTGYYRIIGGDGIIRKEPNETSEPINEISQINVAIKNLSYESIVEVSQVINYNEEKWAIVNKIKHISQRGFYKFTRLEYLFRKVADCYFPIICEQNDIKLLPFADAKNVEENTKGKKLYVIAQYENKYGNTWYGVSDTENGSHIGYVNINNIRINDSLRVVTFDQYKDSKTGELLYPSGILEHGKSKTLGGIIHTNESIYEVRAEVVSQTTGKVVKQASCYPNETAKEININSDVNGKNINKMIKFSSLDVDYYWYRIWVVFGYRINGVPCIGTSKLVFEEKFQIGNPSVPEPTDPPTQGDKIVYTITLTKKEVYSANELKTSLIIWLNEDGSVFDTTNEEHGTVPTHEAPIKENTTEKSYVFSGWTPNVVEVSGPATYQAVFSEVTNSYTITWKNEDGTVIDTTSVEYGKVPTHAEPTKAGTAEIGYSFAGWEPSVTAVTGDAEYKAKFTQYTKSYSVTWQNADETTLQTDVLAYGTMPAYAGDTPTLPENSGFTYTFIGWEPEVTKVTGNITYTALYLENGTEEPDIPPEEESEYYTYSGSGQNYVKDSGEDKQFSVKRSDDDDKTFTLFRGIQVDAESILSGNAGCGRSCADRTL